MSLKTIKRLAAGILKCGESRVRILDAKKAGEALTREDVRGLISDGVVRKTPFTGVGRGKAKLKQKRKKLGRRRGSGSRKGAKFSTFSRKERWIQKVRAQRNLLTSVKDGLEAGAYKNLYRMIKGNAFRDKKHLKDFLIEKNLLKKRVQLK